jgi:hypothetical protein
MIERGVAMVDKSGFQGATVEHVADEAKIAKGTIYLYFDTGLARRMNERAGLDLCNCCRGGRHYSHVRSNRLLHTTKQ